METLIMKVVFAHDNYFYKGNGEKVYSEVQFSQSVWTRYLDAFDEVVVAARLREMPEDKKPESMNLSSRSNVSFVSIPNMSSLSGKITDYHKCRAILTKVIHDSDALIVRLPSEIGFIAASIAVRLRKPWAVEVVGHVWDSYWNYGSLQGKLYAPIATRVMKRIVKRAPFAIYVTEQYLQELYPCAGMTSYASNVEIIPVSVEVLERRLERIISNTSTLNIGLIGSLYAKYKGIDTALLAIKHSIGKIPPIQFRILGGGNQAPWLQLVRRLGLEDCVVFCGTLQGNDVSYWLDDIDLYIQPSLTEGLPRALIEAMSRGCPALGSSVGGIPELLNGEYLHPPKQSTSLSNLLIRVLNQKEERIQMARSNFSLSKQYDKPLIDARRNEFWQRFHDYVREGDWR
jgi:glycosyltransferase involved in cell wall biosynthesis